MYKSSPQSSRISSFLYENIVRSCIKLAALPWLFHGPTWNVESLKMTMAQYKRACVQRCKVWCRLVRLRFSFQLDIRYAQSFLRSATSSLPWRYLEILSTASFLQKISPSSKYPDSLDSIKLKILEPWPKSERCSPSVTAHQSDAA